MTELVVQSPYNGEVLQTLVRQDAAAVESVVAASAAVFHNRKQWLSVAERIQILERFYNLFAAQAETITLQAVREGGKPLQDSQVEIARALQGVKIALETIHEMVGREIPMGLTKSSEQRIAFTVREPVGVVLAISAFNHPVNLIIHQVIPAIAVGCPVIVKPASATPLSCLTIVSLLHAAGLPPAWCQAVICENEVIEKVVSDPRINFLTFIGSAKVGWHLRSILAPGTGCALEHGGVAPVIVEPDANLAHTIPLLAKGGFYHAGQVCVSVQRIFVHQDIYATVCTQLTKAVQALKVGDPLDPATDVGPLISATEVARIHNWVQEAQAAGGTLLCGGQPRNHQCYAPTIVAQPPAHVKLSREEVFGPVVCIYSYTDLDAAIAQANALPYEFQSAIFTENINTATYAAQQLAAKTVLINDHTAFRVDWMPFGGRKRSGYGVGGIPYTMHEMTFEKMIVTRSVSASIT